MSRGTAYYDLPNGERIELPTTMPDVEEVPGPLCDGKFELPEAVKDIVKVTIDGKTYETSWANVVLVEE